MINLTLLHINDLHGRVSQLSRIATLVRQIRQEVETNGGYCLFLDGGDSEDTTLLESSLTKGSAMEAILRGAGCDYVALGNAIPGRYGPRAVAGLARAFGRPLLCANMKDESGRVLEGLEPFSILTMGSLKVGLIGLTAPNDSYTTFFKLKMDQPGDILPGLIAEVRAQGAKTVLLLSHLSSNVDQTLADNIDGMDVIIGAHDHKELDPPLLVKDTIVAQAGDFGRFLGRLDLMVEPDTGKVLQHKGKLIPITIDIPLDPETQRAIEAEQKRAHAIMNREIGILNEAIELSDDRECAAGNLLADALLERVKDADLALILAGHWQNGLEAGVLTQGTLFTANRSTANPARAELTGEQILSFLREALKPRNAARQIGPLRGRAVGMPHIAGARLAYSDDLEQIEVDIHGKRLEKERRYIVASTDMEFADYINYLVIPFTQMEFEVPTIMPEVLEEYVTKHSPIQKPGGGRILFRAK
jgi:2',3'-cyclic-nucleotide 2'-phosphodiesterase (5'-nucleotidase family)